MIGKLSLPNRAQLANDEISTTIINLKESL